MNKKIYVCIYVFFGERSAKIVILKEIYSENCERRYRDTYLRENMGLPKIERARINPF